MSPGPALEKFNDPRKLPACEAYPAKRCSPSGSVHFMSQTVEWATPQDYFDKVNAEFGPFTLDVCATPQNAKCAEFFTAEQDGLRQEWAPRRCWMNPPYGRVIGDWMRKAYEESKRGATVACLVPARTDTRWWHDYAMKGQIRFIRGRLKFGAGKANAPFPSALIVFTENNTTQYHFDRAEKLSKRPNPVSPLDSFDARDWAKEFMRCNNGLSGPFVSSHVRVDEETMVGWFANALMRGYDERRSREGEIKQKELSDRIDKQPEPGPFPADRLRDMARRIAELESWLGTKKYAPEDNLASKTWTKLEQLTNRLGKLEART